MDAYPFLAYFTVGCPCGERATHPLGYHAKDKGPDAVDMFISPLAIECPVPLGVLEAAVAQHLRESPRV